MARDDFFTTSKQDEPNLALGIAAGLVSGLVASFVMTQFQAAVQALGAPKEDGEPTTQKAADKVAVAVTGRKVPEKQKAAAGELVHYALGAALGVGYGVAAEYRPAVTAGFGTAFGLGAAALLDETAVPASGLAPPPWQTPASTHLYAAISHLVFGAVTELTRRTVRAAA